MIVMSAEGNSLTMYAVKDDKVFMVESAFHKGRESAAVAALVRDCRWLFGPDKRLVYLARDNVWKEIILGDEEGAYREVPYEGEIPVEE